MSGLAAAKTKKRVKDLLEAQEHRGKNKTVLPGSTNLGHSKLVEHKKQVDEQQELILDGKIYHSNDLKDLAKAIETNSLNEIDAEYAFIKRKKDKLVIGRDLAGSRPLWIGFSKEYELASEAKALENPVKPVLPGETLEVSEQGIKVLNRVHWQKPKELKKKRGKLKETLVESIKKRAEGLEKAGLLFSGGVDSSILAKVLKDELNLTCYCAGYKDSPDLEYSEKVAEELGLELEKVSLTRKEIKELIPETIKAIESGNVMKVGVAMPFLACAKKAEETTMFSGVGAEELFAGYSRHKQKLEESGWKALQEEMWKGIESAWQRDLYRDNLALASESKELETPFMDKKMIEESMKIHPSLKINKNYKKKVLRDIANELNVPSTSSKRPKKAAQYGSRTDREMRKIAKKEGEKVWDYLESIEQSLQ